MYQKQTVESDSLIKPNQYSKQIICENKCPPCQFPSMVSKHVLNKYKLTVHMNFKEFKIGVMEKCFKY